MLVLLEPDGTIVELNRKEAAWRDPQPDRRDRQEDLGRADAAGLSAAHPADEARGRAGGEGRAVQRGSDDGARGRSDRLPRHLGPAGARRRTATIIYLLFEARDITDLKAAQEQLRQSQKMEALGQLTGGIAHDFNNLLTVVVGGLDIVAKRAEDEKLKRYAENALSAAERGARLTGQLLAFSRVQRLEVRPTPVAPLIVNMRPLLRNVLGPGIEKRFDLDDEDAAGDGRPDPARGRGPQPRDQRPRRHARRRRADLRAPARCRSRTTPSSTTATMSSCAITDTGGGMNEDVAARAFEPFFTTKEVGKGTGLGLSMVYGMARQSGGSARIDSTARRRHHGQIVVPRRRPGRAAGRPAKPTPSSQRTERRSDASMLVIDDDPDVRGFIVASLEEQGYRVARGERRPQGPQSVRATSGPTWSSSTSSCRACPAPKSPTGSSPTRPASRSCSSPAIARPRRCAGSRPTRRCWPSRSAPTRWKKRSKGALAGSNGK